MTKYYLVEVDELKQSLGVDDLVYAKKKNVTEISLLEAEVLRNTIDEIKRKGQQQAIMVIGWSEERGLFSKLQLQFKGKHSRESLLRFIHSQLDCEKSRLIAEINKLEKVRSYEFKNDQEANDEGETK